MHKSEKEVTTRRAMSIADFANGVIGNMEYIVIVAGDGVASVASSMETKDDVFGVISALQSDMESDRDRQLREIPEA